MKRNHAGVISAVSNFNPRQPPKQPYGLISIPPMILFPNFDLTYGFTIDYMHNAALNVTKLLIDFWMGQHRLCKNSKYFKPLAPKSRDLLNKRLLSIKPCSYIVRKPRSLNDRAYFKAVEYRYYLLFYLRFALHGLLGHNELKHFELFSASVYILLKSKINKTELEEARVMLKRFADDFEKFFHYYEYTHGSPLCRICHSLRSIMGILHVWIRKKHG